MARRPIYQNGERLPSAPPRVFEDESPTLSQRKQQAFAQSIENRKPKDRKSFTAKKFNARVKDATEMRTTGEWEHATAQHFVALYSIFHKEIYGVDALELRTNQETRTKCVMWASQCLKNHFNGDATEMARYMNYVWTRERGRQKWRIEKQIDAPRLNWYKQFDAALVTDYFADKLRRGKIEL